MGDFSKLALFCILASIGVHLLMGGGVYQTKLPEKLDEPILIDLNYTDSGQYVRETLLKSNTLDLLNTPYVSQFSKKFNQETKAKKTGLTQNKKLNALLKKNTSTSKKEAGLESNFILTSDKKEVGESTISESLPNVKLGTITALNTNKELYYTFYERTSEQIINRWTQNVRNIVSQLNAKLVKKNSQRKQYSELEIILTPDGHFKQVIIHKGAKLKVFDEAAILSFKKASPFLNPPKGLVGEDGNIHLKYSFLVHLDPNQLVRQRQ